MSTPQICTTCGHVGQPKTVTKGHLLIEVFLWCMIFVPGMIYSIWRLTTRHKACPVCGSASIIPTDSPRGKQLMQQMPPAPSAAETASHAAGMALGQAVRKMAAGSSATKSKPKPTTVPIGKFK